jgi:hypothetical protein
MLIAYQVLMMIVILFFSIASVGERDRPRQGSYVAVLITSILSLAATFLLL